MKNMMNHIFKLLKAGYHCKKSIKKGLKQDQNSPTYILAKFYDASFQEFEDNDVTLEDINTLTKQIDVQRAQYHDSTEIQQLLAMTLSFLEELKPFVKHNLA